ncbi:MAG: LSU ribosomal protein L11p (L12e), partial [uncultured Arthrobacter sp.]
GPEEKGHRPHQAADQCRCRQPGTPHWSCAWPARCQHHGILQGIQRGDGVPARERHPRGDHCLRRPFIHLHHEDPSGSRTDQEGSRRPEGFRNAAHRQGCQADPGPGRGDRHHEDGRSQRQRCSGRGQDHRRHRPLDGHHGRGL